MTVLLDQRSQKALEIAAMAAYTWARLPSGAFSIPSQSGSGTYTVSSHWCTCPAFDRNPEQPCKHVISVCIVEALTETQPVPLVKRLPVTVRED